METIQLYDMFGKVIMTRNAITDLFSSVAHINETIVFDFKNIEFISRSAAHEYIRQKSDCNLEIKETQMSQNVKAMFLLVTNQLKKVIA